MNSTAPFPLVMIGLLDRALSEEEVLARRVETRPLAVNCRHESRFAVSSGWGGRTMRDI